MSTWRLLLLVALVAGAELAARGHLGARAGWFYAGLVLLAAGAVGAGETARRAGRPASAFALVALALAAAGLALGSLAVPAAAPERDPAPSPFFEDAAGDPTAYRLWRERTAPSWRALATGDAFAPNARVRIFQDVVELDEAGRRRTAMRPAEARRIDVVGGARVFGATRQRGDRDWPAHLEERIGAQLACAAPVRVVNDGRPGRDLAAIAARLERTLEPAPDLLLVDADCDLAAELDALGAGLGAAPQVPPRTSPWLRRMELHWRQDRFAAQWRRAAARPLAGVDLSESDCGGLYRRLLVAARQRGVDVALLIPPRAVGPGSAEDRLRFYEGALPELRRESLERQLHDGLIRRMAGAYGAPVLDLAEALAAEPDAFLAPLQPSEAGRRRLAAALARELRERLAQEPWRCAPRRPSG